MAADISACQAKGKIVTLSLGGASASVGFLSDGQAATFAQTIWDLFLGGSSSIRPFGTAVLDGIDLDIEGGSSASYTTFINTIRSRASGASKKYYITAAPQCVFPDAALSSVLNAAIFDAVYGSITILAVFNRSVKNWNFGLWDDWARFTSPNKNVKIYIGAPASPSAAGSGYQHIDTMKNISVSMRKSFPSFGGVMLWDVSQAYANGRYDLAVKNALVAAGGTGFTFPACSAPVWTAGDYVGGSLVTYNGYVWQAKWYASSQPAANPNGDWSALTACTGSGMALTLTCGGVAAWASTAIYVGGNQVTFQYVLGHVPSSESKFLKVSSLDG
ncbi:hypothetical protein C0989_004032 [Termitomyces sp. Mn162]|nr:hypothetical protein C0989_004032 [Termitomyces sp. Mn162]